MTAISALGRLTSHPRLKTSLRARIYHSPGSKQHQSELRPDPVCRWCPAPPASHAFSGSPTAAPSAGCSRTPPAPCRALSTAPGTSAACSWQKAGPQSQSPTPPSTGCRSQLSPWPRRRSPCRRSVAAAPWPAGWAARRPVHSPDALLVGRHRVTDKKPAAPLVGGCWRLSMAECLPWTASGRVSGPLEYLLPFWYLRASYGRFERRQLRLYHRTVRSSVCGGWSIRMWTRPDCAVSKSAS